MTVRQSVPPFLFFSLVSIERQVCHLPGSKRELWPVSNQPNTGFLCDPLELPVFQQKGRADSANTGSFRRLTVQHIPARQAKPWADIVTARLPQKNPLKLAYILAWLVLERI